jgi:hypothetical protein
LILLLLSEFLLPLQLLLSEFQLPLRLLLSEFLLPLQLPYHTHDRRLLYHHTPGGIEPRCGPEPEGCTFFVRAAYALFSIFLIIQQ